MKPEPTTTKPGAKHRTARPSAIPLWADDEYPPDVRVLSDADKRFAIALVYVVESYNTPDAWYRRAEEAAWLAGIGGTRQMARIEGMRRMRKPPVLTAIRALEEDRRQADLPTNRAVLASIRDSPKAKAADRIKAATYLDGTGGMTQKTEHHTTISHEATLSTSELRKQLAELYRDHPELREVEGPKEVPIEGEFAPVETPEAA